MVNTPNQSTEINIFEENERSQSEEEKINTNGISEEMLRHVSSVDTNNIRVANDICCKTLPSLQDDIGEKFNLSFSIEKHKKATDPCINECSSTTTNNIPYELSSFKNTMPLDSENIDLICDIENTRHGDEIKNENIHNLNINNFNNHIEKIEILKSSKNMKEDIVESSQSINSSENNNTAKEILGNEESTILLSMLQDEHSAVFALSSTNIQTSNCEIIENDFLNKKEENSSVSVDCSDNFHSESTPLLESDIADIKKCKNEAFTEIESQSYVEGEPFVNTQDIEREKLDYEIMNHVDELGKNISKNGDQCAITIITGSNSKREEVESESNIADESSVYVHNTEREKSEINLHSAIMNHIDDLGKNISNNREECTIANIGQDSSKEGELICESEIPSNISDTYPITCEDRIGNIENSVVSTKQNKIALLNTNLGEKNEFNKPELVFSETKELITEKIGSSLKLMFEAGDVLDKHQKLTNLQSNTMKKVNTLFSNFSNYNFTNFRRKEITDEKRDNLKLKNSERNRERTFNSDSLENKIKDDFNNKKVLIENDKISSSNVTIGRNNISAKPSKNIISDITNTCSFSKELHSIENVKNVLNIDESIVNRIVKSHHIDTTDEIDTKISNIGSHSLDGDATANGPINKVVEENELSSQIVMKNHNNSNKLQARSNLNHNIQEDFKINILDEYKLNTNLIHTVRNAPHVNKSISLDSTPVKNNARHALQDELYLLKETNIRLLGEISWLEEEKNKMKKDFRQYMEETELYKKSLNEQIIQHDLQREQMRLQQEVEAKTQMQARLDLETKLEKLKKDLELANKEKESSVMKYVMKESELINLRKDKEQTEKKVKEAVSEKNNVVNKLKVLSTEKARLTQLFDDKCTEYNILQRSMDKANDELTGKDIKLKWLQSKLDKEIESNKQLTEKSQMVEDNQISKDAEQNRLKLSEDSQRLFLQEIDVLKKKNQGLTQENNILSLKVQKLEKERLDSDENLSKCKAVVNSQTEEINQLKNQISNMEDLRNQLHTEHERLLAKDAEVERVQKNNFELTQDMATCRSREAELLQFTEKLTEKNVRLQSEFSALECKAENLEKDVAPLTLKITQLESDILDLKSNLDNEKQGRDQDNKAMARVVAEKTKQVQNLTQQLEEMKNENQILKRKHTSTIRELNKELSSLKKKCEACSNNVDTHTLGYGSRASSCTSLNDTQHSPTSASIASTLSSTLQLEPDRNVLIERIVELQRSHAKTIEKVEFLEEHNSQLVNELQKKSRIIQSYILREQSGALSSRSMDVNKAEVSKHGGIMASLYSSKPSDGSMTLELSLEINRKLQAVLEDTILKNITLKENIDTLGEQIEKLSKRS